ncbi:hypothetical protein SLITO_v1c05850 [Spiroplasma litorale]|uniref:Uncharacterized protein n=1 Tax=Spiroplasma litorale TaxID=216942 RepID=A0A0K1W1M0_9MOLU|nr:hypothetical protein [Spiroplasma litorale]AKX34219.1 hypothetical protein SLITO_v1c05850 [Spiroplasma litorale]
MTASIVIKDFSIVAFIKSGLDFVFRSSISLLYSTVSLGFTPSIIFKLTSFLLKLMSTLFSILYKITVKVSFKEFVELKLIIVSPTFILSKFTLFDSLLIVALTISDW